MQAGAGSAKSLACTGRGAPGSFVEVADLDIVAAGARCTGRLREDAGSDSGLASATTAGRVEVISDQADGAEQTRRLRAARERGALVVGAAVSTTVGDVRTYTRNKGADAASSQALAVAKAALADVALRCDKATEFPGARSFLAFGTRGELFADAVRSAAIAARGAGAFRDTE